MKVLIGGRGSGVTTDLIQEAIRFGTPILCRNKRVMAQMIIKEIEKMYKRETEIDGYIMLGTDFNISVGIDKVEKIRLIDYSDLTKDRLRGKRFNRIIVSDFEYFFKNLLSEHMSFNEISTIGDSIE